MGHSSQLLPSGILSGQIQKAPPVYGSFYACYSYRYPQETPRPLPECRQILGELSAAGGRADTVGSSGSVRKFRHVPQVVGVGSGAGVRPWELIRCRNGDSNHQKRKSTSAFMKSVRFLPGGVQNVPRSSCAFAVGVSCPSTVKLYPRAGRLSAGLLCAL